MPASSLTVWQPWDGLAGLRSVAAGGSLTVNGTTLVLGGPVANDGAVTLLARRDAGRSPPVRERGPSGSAPSGSPTGGYSAAQLPAARMCLLTGTMGSPGSPGPPDGGAEFLTVGFATPDFADGVIVRETNLPGFVTKVEAVDTDNVTHTVWTGTVSRPAHQVSDFLITWPRTAYRVKAVTIHINTALKPGWEAIDAVQGNWGEHRVHTVRRDHDGRGRRKPHADPGTAYAQSARWSWVWSTAPCRRPSR